MELSNELEIHELKRKTYLLENEMKGFQDVMSQAMDKFLLFFQNQETSLKSYVNKPRTLNTMISFMDDLLGILVAMDSKKKDQDKLLEEAKCTNMELLRKQKYIEDKISDMLTCSCILDIKTVLKQLVKKYAISTVNTFHMSTDNCIKSEAVDHDAPNIGIETVAVTDTNMNTQVSNVVEHQDIKIEMPLYDRLDLNLHNTDDIDTDGTEDYEQVSDNGATCTNYLKHATIDDNLEVGTINRDLSKKIKVEIEDNQSVPPAQSGYVCKWCNKTFKKQGLLKSHSLTHSGKKTHECTICLLIFATPGELRVHTRIHTGEKPYSCQICSKRFRVSKDCNRHKRIHNKDEQFKCHLCPSTFTRRTSRRQHISKHHPFADFEDNPIKLKTVPDGSRKASNIVVKTELTSGIGCHNTDDVDTDGTEDYETLDNRLPANNLEQAMADDCGDVSSSGGYLLKNNKVKDKAFQYILAGKNEEHICLWCNKIFKRLSYLKDHIRVHTGDRPYQCATCGKTFRVSKDLTVHNRIHNKDDQLKCELCPSSFTRRRNLQNHILTKHLNQKLFLCNICGQSFKGKYSLKNHVSKHSGTKDMKCNFCDETFYNKQGVYRHVRSYHKGIKRK